MSKILLKMHIAEGYASVLPKEVNSNQLKNMDSLIVFDNTILKEFNISKKTFDENINYYKTQPAKLDSIYLNILNEISLLQTKVKN